MRPLLPLLAAGAACGLLVSCGTPCSRVANAEADATAKGKACSGSTTTWSSERLTRCEQNLSKCSPDDTKWLDTYADCLYKLQPCSEGQGFSYGLSRLACLESYLKVSLSCSSSID